MATAIDNFNRATLGPDWTITSAPGSIAIIDNSVYSAANADNVAYWTPDSFSSDQYAAATITQFSTNVFIGVAVRISADTGAGRDCYGYYIDNNERYLFKLINGTWTQLGPAATSVTNTPPLTARLEVQGTTLRPILNGSLDPIIGAQTDSDLSSGQPGITGFGNGNGTRLDDWSGGDLAASTPFSTAGSITPSSSLVFFTYTTKTGNLVPAGLLSIVKAGIPLETGETMFTRIFPGNTKLALTEIGTGEYALATTLISAAGQSLYDQFTGALPMIDVPHAMIHQGKFFIAAYRTPAPGIANGNTLEFLIQVPASTYPHLELVMFSQGNYDFDLYEGTTFSAAGTPISAANHNRNSANTAATNVSHTPTITSDGSLIWTGSQANLIGGSTNTRQEWVLKPGENYLLRLTNRRGSDSVMGAQANWYEP